MQIPLSGLNKFKPGKQGIGQDRETGFCVQGAGSMLAGEYLVEELADILLFGPGELLDLVELAFEP